jgi:carboxypeptidase C (cathepsin A)
MCIGELCYAENEVIKAYLDLPSTRSLLGVDMPGNFSSCSALVSQNFVAHMDKWAVPTQYYVAGLLDRGVRVLIYAGTYDWQCNWVANRLWVDKLEWSGKEGYGWARWRNWGVRHGAPKAGEVKSWGLLTFATIRGAGHMMSFFFFISGDFETDFLSSFAVYVPHDKPEESLVMVRRWLAGKEL